MKPTERQKELIDKILNEIKRLSETNDINSPSHYNGFDEFVDSLEYEGFKVDQDLNNALMLILNVVRINK